MPTVGSSSTSSSGSGTTARAKRTRWACPPDSFWVSWPAIPAIPVSSRTSSTSSGFGNSAAIICTSSRTVRSRRREPVCSIAPTRPPSTTADGSWPKTDTVPASGPASPRIASIVVDLPAPFGPRSATVSRGAIETSIPHTAGTTVSPVRYDLTRPRSSMPPALPAIAPMTPDRRLSRGSGFVKAALPRRAPGSPAPPGSGRSRNPPWRAREAAGVARPPAADARSRPPPAR